MQRVFYSLYDPGGCAASRCGHRSGLKRFSIQRSQRHPTRSSTYSDNAVPFRRQPTGATNYIGNGTDHALLTKGTPPVGARSKSSAPPKGPLLDLADGPVAVSATSQTLSAQVPDQTATSGTPKSVFRFIWFSRAGVAASKLRASHGRLGKARSRLLSVPGEEFVQAEVVKRGLGSAYVSMGSTDTS
jgi:hypothetical protein